MKNKFLFLIIFSVFFIFLCSSTVYGYGECTKYGGMAIYDSFSHTCKCISGYVFDDSYGFTSCVSCSTKYGIGSTYDYSSGGCKCSSGYMVKNDYSGQKCVSIDQECKNQYGVMSRYDSLSDKCKCSIGYLFGTDSIGRTQCISEDDWCQNKYGYNSQYDSLSDECECRSGYEFTLKSGRLDCVSCSSKYGTHSSYDYFSKKCECDDGYTLDDDNQCVKKQNNVYFLLEALDLSNNKAIIKSDYDYKEYLIRYGAGCYSIENYLNKKLVINLGIDFDLDAWDKIVLQNNSQICDIISKERTYDSSDLCEDGYILKNSNCVKINCPSNSTLIGDQCFCDDNYEIDSSGLLCKKIVKSIIIPKTIVQKDNIETNSKIKNTINSTKREEDINTGKPQQTSGDFKLTGNERIRECGGFNCKVIKFGSTKTATILEKNGDWVKIKINDIGDTIEGWMSASLVPDNINQIDSQNVAENKNDDIKKENGIIKFLKNIFSFFGKN